MKRCGPAHLLARRLGLGFLLESHGSCVSLLDLRVRELLCLGSGRCRLGSLLLLLLRLLLSVRPVGKAQNQRQ
jgi:hypothetical protein